MLKTRRLLTLYGWNSGYAGPPTTKRSTTDVIIDMLLSLSWSVQGETILYAILLLASSNKSY